VHTAEGGRDAPRGNPPHHAAAARLSAVATAAAAEARPRQLAVLSERRNPPRARERDHPPGAATIEAEQDHRQGRLCTQDNRSPSSHVVHIHAKTTLTVIFHRFDPTPVGKLGRSGSLDMQSSGHRSACVHRETASIRVVPEMSDPTSNLS
jgi:hypothetical protein